MPTYYDILGITPDASSEVIKQAYRERAMKWHPDRGGSHEKMVLINEAWFILSNPITRKNYNSLIRNNNDHFFQQSMYEDVASAKKAAQDYPKEWHAFEYWLDKLFKDFTDVKYGGFIYPSVKGSISGWLFILLGGFLGFVGSFVLGCVVLCLDIESYELRAIIKVMTIGGAWVGYASHKKVGNYLKDNCHMF